MWCIDMESFISYITDNLIDGVLVIVLASSDVDRGFKRWLNQTENEKIGICCFFAHSIKEKEHRLVGSESAWCVRVLRYIYPRTVVSVG